MYLMAKNEDNYKIFAIDLNQPLIQLFFGVIPEFLQIYLGFSN
jgi:hypothetical protein